MFVYLELIIKKIHISAEIIQNRSQSILLPTHVHVHLELQSQSQQFITCAQLSDYAHITLRQESSPRRNSKGTSSPGQV